MSRFSLSCVLLVCLCAPTTANLEVRVRSSKGHLKQKLVFQQVQDGQTVGTLQSGGLPSAPKELEARVEAKGTRSVQRAAGVSRRISSQGTLDPKGSPPPAPMKNLKDKIQASAPQQQAKEPSAPDWEMDEDGAPITIDKAQYDASKDDKGYVEGESIPAFTFSGKIKDGKITVEALIEMAPFTDTHRKQFRNGEYLIKAYQVPANTADNQITDTLLESNHEHMTLCILGKEAELTTDANKNAPADKNNCLIGPRTVLQLAVWGKLAATGKKADIVLKKEQELTPPSAQGAPKPGKFADFWTKFQDIARICDGKEGADCAAPAPTAPKGGKAPLQRTQKSRDLGKVHDGPTALFVMGPSAAGKTFNTKANVVSLMEKNQVTQAKSRVFISVDGGLMREASKAWAYGWSECLRKARSAGCSDLYSTFSGHFKKVKRWIFNELVSQKKDLIIVDTGTGSGNAPSLKKNYQPLHDAGYKMLMSAVYSSRASCRFSGLTRAFSEGKQYPLNDIASFASWISGVKAVASHFKAARAKKDGSVGTQMMLVRNKYTVKSPDDVKDACKADVFSHMRCGGSGVKFFSKDFVWKFGNGDALPN